MSEIFQTGSAGERLLADYLRAQGRTVQASDLKTFDLRVDGKYAEVKSSRSCYSSLGFVGLTENQYQAAAGGEEFLLFIVCNLEDPENLEVVEIPSSELLREEPKVESTYYWYRSQLEKVRSNDLDSA